jgi:serine/threonine protein phosphatase PrpC
MPNLPLVSGARSDAGRRRSNNEDACFADDALGLYVVCDGVGGNASGEVASSAAVAALRSFVVAEQPAIAALATSSNQPDERLNARLMELVERAVQRACAEVHRRRAESAAHAGMSTTLDCVLRVGSKLVIGHVGDGRIYLLRSGVLYRLTEDHTIIAEQLRAGLMTEAQAAESTMKGVLTRSLGSHASVQVDRLVLEAATGDVLLLCSDGLHGLVRDDHIAELVRGNAPLDLPRVLVDQANAAGGTDNVSVVAICVVAPTIDRRSVLARARIEAIGQTPLLASLSYKERVAMLAIATSHRVEAGEVVMREGEVGSDMFVVVRGRLAVSKAGAHIADLGPGGLVGEMAMVDAAPRSATVVAVETTDLISFSHAAMTTLMRAEPALGNKLLWSIIASMSGKLRSSSESLAKPG